MIAHERDVVVGRSTETVRDEFTCRAETVYFSKSEFKALLGSHIPRFLPCPEDPEDPSVLDVKMICRLALQLSISESDSIAKYDEKD